MTAPAAGRRGVVAAVSAAVLALGLAAAPPPVQATVVTIDFTGFIPDPTPPLPAGISAEIAGRLVYDTASAQATLGAQTSRYGFADGAALSARFAGLDFVSTGTSAEPLFIEIAGGAPHPGSPVGALTVFGGHAVTPSTSFEMSLFLTSGIGAVPPDAVLDTALPTALMPEAFLGGDSVLRLSFAGGTVPGIDQPRGLTFLIDGLAAVAIDEPGSSCLLLGAIALGLLAYRYRAA
jgi:hypothetical protein